MGRRPSVPIPSHFHARLRSSFLLPWLWFACSTTPQRGRTAFGLDGSSLPVTPLAVASAPREPPVIASAATSTSLDATAQDYTGESTALSDEPDDDEADSDREDSAERPHPFDTLTSTELLRLLREDPKSLGSASLGRPNAGAVFNAVQLPEHAAWKREDPVHAWATEETVEYLTQALLAVAKHFPNTPAVSIGHLSASKGGPLRPHVSHQSGRDVDVGFYYASEPKRWYRRATAETLDIERTWWLIRTLVLETDIEMVLIDRSLIPPLERFAIESGEAPEWVESIFHRCNGRPAIVRHAPGHATHLHLRFFNPIAQQSGRRLAPMLVKQGVVKAPQKTIPYVARSGDTLAKLAARHSTTMQAIRQANSMRTYQLVAGRTYRIPVKGNALETKATNVPKRRQPSSGRLGK